MKTMLMAASMVLASSWAVQAQTIEMVRVRLPSGQVITVDDGRTWRYDERVRMYDRYYYDSRDRVYVVYDPRNPPPWAREHSRWCPPGQAKKGRC